MDTDELCEIGSLHMGLFALRLTEELPVAIGDDRMVVGKLDMHGDVLRAERNAKDGASENQLRPLRMSYISSR